MAKYSKLTKDVRHLRDEIDRKWIGVISIAAFLAIGIWMLLDPQQPEHNEVEKTSVYLMKEIWSWQVGTGIALIAVPILIRNVIRLIRVKGKVWIKIFPDLPITSKPIEVRMGKGKGALSH